ncbi:MAG: SPOR domain-containing protein [Chlorobi bacterium]|nr:SPOR domain-containing protein [Chlorobiota bacterium]
MIKFIVVFMIFVSFVAKGQIVTNELPTDWVQQNVPGEGEVVIHQEPGIDFLLDTHIEMNKRHRYFDGYRIQLYSGSGQRAKHSAMDVKAKLLELYPDEKVYLSFTAPFWRVRVGNYRNKNEALELLGKLRKKFPNAYIVKDGKIKLDDLYLGETE